MNNIAFKGKISNNNNGKLKVNILDWEYRNLPKDMSIDKICNKFGINYIYISEKGTTNKNDLISFFKKSKVNAYSNPVILSKKHKKLVGSIQNVRYDNDTTIIDVKFTVDRVK